MTIVLSSFRARLEATERDLAIEALRVSNGGIVAAARLCGLHKSQMRRIVVRYHLENLLKPAPRARVTLQSGNAGWHALEDE